MLAGVAVIEAGLLCVDAREGWRAQTEEHLQILDLIGLPAGLIAVTKAGLVDAQRIAAVRDEVARGTAGTVLAGAPVVACDAIDRTGLDELRDRLGRCSPLTRSTRPSTTGHGCGSIGPSPSPAPAPWSPGASVTARSPSETGWWPSARRGDAAARVRGIEALGQRVGRAPARPAPP